MATALSVAVMIIAVAVVQGYKDKIFDKMFVFWGHFHVALANPNPSSVISPEPIEYNDTLVNILKKQPGIVAVFPFAVKPAIISDSGIVEGIKIKGVDQSYPFVSGDAIHYTGNIQFPDSGYASQIILSEYTLHKLRKKTGESLLVYFVNNGEDAPAIRKLKISGAYRTGVEEIDQSFAICDIDLLRRVSGWDAHAVNGYQVEVDNFRHTDQIADNIYQQYLEPPLTYNTIRDIYPDIESWLSLIDVNTQVIIVIMSIVAIINMATAILIFIMERTSMVGVLKSLGMNNKKLWWIFLYHAARVAITGILIGAGIGVGVCLLQQFTHLLRLNESTYYVSYAPVVVIWWQVLLVVAGTILLVIITLMLPALIVRKINMAKALQFK